MSELFQGIASLTKTVQQTLNSYEVRKLGDKVQGYVMNFTETEQKVREATNEDPWGPTGPEMQEIASLTFQYDQFSEVMGMLWKRMFQDNKVAWRRVYKSLILLNHLLKNGSERVISTARDHIFEMRALESYKCVDERGKDEGINVRHRVKLILELLNDEELIRTERRKAKTESREKYQGFSKDDMLVRGGGSSKIDSFERWNEKKESKSMDFDKKSGGRDGVEDSGIGKREVTAFDFDEARSHANGSPELGIRERTPELPADNDDDDFGDFTSARAGTNATTVATESAQFSIIKVPPLTPPSQLKSKMITGTDKQAKLPSNSNVFGGEVDLLGLDEFGSRNHSLPDPSKTSGKIILDDIFVSSPSALPSADASNPVGTTKTAGNTADLFDLFTSPPMMANNQTPIGIVHHSPPSSFDLLSGDGAGTVHSNGKQLNATFTPFGQSHQQNNGNTVTPTKQPTKLPSTWDDFKGKVNLDFENLSLKNSPTKTPTLNELKKTTPSKESGSF